MPMMPDRVFLTSDVPYRVQNTHKVPIACMVRNCSRQAISLRQVEIRADMDESIVGTWTYAPDMLGEDSQSILPNEVWHKVFVVELPHGFFGDVSLFVSVAYGRATNATSRRPVPITEHSKISQPIGSVLVSPDNLPSAPGWEHGDFYYLATLMNGSSAPADVIVALGKAMGLSWGVALNARSKPNALNEQRWLSTRKKLVSINRDTENFALLGGDIVETINSSSKFVRLLTIGLKQAITSQISVPVALKEVNNHGGISFAAGPFAKPGNILGRIFSNHGHWDNEDCQLEGLSGLRILDSKPLDLESPGFYEGRSLWIRQLLERNMRYLLAGSDASPRSTHRGATANDLNKGRPQPQIFGTLRTVVYCPQGLTVASVIEAIAHGNSFITEGPFLAFRLQNVRSQEAMHGESIQGRTFQMSVLARTSAEFGDFKDIMAIVGDTDRHCEDILLALFGKSCEGQTKIQFTEEDILTNKTDIRKGYIRLEAETSTGGRTYSAFTNPIWFERLA